MQRHVAIPNFFERSKRLPARLSCLELRIIDKKRLTGFVNLMYNGEVIVGLDRDIPKKRKDKKPN